LEKRNAIESLANHGRHFDLVFSLTKKLVVPKHFGKKLNGQDKPLKERSVGFSNGLTRSSSTMCKYSSEVLLIQHHSSSGSNKSGKK
jgi:hypothetical protein